MRASMCVGIKGTKGLQTLRLGSGGTGCEPVLLHVRRDHIPSPGAHQQETLDGQGSNSSEPVRRIPFVNWGEAVIDKEGRQGGATKD